MASRKQLPRITPNTDDPLTEPTIGRRQWALYLERGYNRNTWAHALEVTYMTAYRWEGEEIEPNLSNLLRMTTLLGVTLHELVFGYHIPRLDGSIERELTDEGVKALTREMRASNEAIEAFGAYMASPAGRYQTKSRTYVAAWLACYDTSRREGGLEPEQALAAAREAASNARGNAEAVATRAQPLSTEALASIGEAVHRKTVRAKIATSARAVATAPERRKKLARKAAR